MLDWAKVVIASSLLVWVIWLHIKLSLMSRRGGGKDVR